MMEGLLILESIDPSVCEGATAPECEQGISGPKIKGWWSGNYPGTQQQQSDAIIN